MKEMAPATGCRSVETTRNPTRYRPSPGCTSGCTTLAPSTRAGGEVRTSPAASVTATARTGRRQPR